MTVLHQIFGGEDHLGFAQECARALLIFFYGLLLLRLSGRRTFVHWSALDLVISIIVGSALARTMTGSAPLLGTMAAAAILTALHVIVGHATARSPFLARIVEGHAVKLAQDGRIDHELCRKHMISDSELAGALRQQGVDGDSGLENVKLMMLETSGKISVVKHDPCKADRP
jgi:uncharacterized membrane protein YcaP (DUF421 family)